MLKLNLLGLALFAAVALEFALAQDDPSCPDGEWTVWYDRDNPGGTGDWENLSHLQNENPGLCRYPINIQVTQTNGAAIPSWQVVTMSITAGFYCQNALQPQRRRCLDYRVRFCCPKPRVCKHPYSWTDWIDLDDPTGTGDWEMLSDHVASDQDGYCKKPANIDARLTDGRPYQLGFNIFTYFSPSQGLVCENDLQPGEKCCADYQVRYCCKLCENGTIIDPTDVQEVGVAIQVAEVNNEALEVASPTRT